jgi:uncharacterized membrane protein
MHNPNTRLEAFCDGVFAIALTLLIIEIKVPPVESVHSKQELWHAFAHHWPSWVAFFISFITILISWVNHSAALKLISKSSPKFSYANGLLLLSVTILPFPTAAVAEYMNTDLAQPAVTLYCGASLLNNLAWNVIMFVCRRESLYHSHVDMDKVRATDQYVKFGFVFYSVAFITSFWYPLLGFIMISVSFVAWLILGITIREEKMTIGKE